MECFVLFSNRPVGPTLVENVISGHLSVSSATNNIQGTIYALSLAKGTLIYPKPVQKCEIQCKTVN